MDTDTLTRQDETYQLQRTIDWKSAFWLASGVPALVLFSIGGIAGTVGIPAFAVWALSMLFGFVQSFTYAEIAGLFPNKSGGASVYGAAAWLKYSKLIAPLSVWCNWLAWTPVLSLGCTIAAGYILNAYAPIPAADSPAVQEWLRSHAGATPIAAVAALTPAVRTWSLVNINVLGAVHVSIGATFLIGASLTLLVFAIQHRGILGTSRVQLVIGLLVIVPMLIFGVVPFLNGHVSKSNFSPFVPLATPYVATQGQWNIQGWTLVLGGLFIAAWSTYAFETAICYTSEFKNPGTDTFKAIFSSGLLCIIVFFVLAISNCGYIIFNFLNLNSGWIHRIDNGHIERPWKAPTAVLSAGAVLAFVNAFLMGAGAQVWNPKALAAALVAALLIIPVFCYRHYVQDGGKFPDRMLEDLGSVDGRLGERKAGILPYLALAGGVLIVVISSRLFHL
jgi:amino acid transporter